MLQRNQERWQRSLSGTSVVRLLRVRSSRQIDCLILLGVMGKFGQSHYHPRASWRTFGSNTPLPRFNNASHGCKPGSPTTGLCRKEWIKGPRSGVVIHAMSGVTDDKLKKLFAVRTPAGFESK